MNIKAFLKEIKKVYKIFKIVEICWTSKKPIYGLRHFVLLNKISEKDQIHFLMVSVIDVEIFLTISKDDLLKSGNWNEGWLNLPRSKAITKDYLDFKRENNSKMVFNKIFVKNDSLFNIS